MSQGSENVWRQQATLMICPENAMFGRRRPHLLRATVQWSGFTSLKLHTTVHAFKPDMIHGLTKICTSPSPLQFRKLVLRCWKEVFPPTTWKLQKERIFMVMESWSHWGWIYKWCLNGSSPGNTFCNLTQAFCLLLQWSQNRKEHNGFQNPSHMWKIRARCNKDIQIPVAHPTYLIHPVLSP